MQGMRGCWDRAVTIEGGASGATASRSPPARRGPGRADLGLGRTRTCADLWAATGMLAHWGKAGCVGQGPPLNLPCRPAGSAGQSAASSDRRVCLTRNPSPPPPPPGPGPPCPMFDRSRRHTQGRNAHRAESPHRALRPAPRHHGPAAVTAPSGPAHPRSESHAPPTPPAGGAIFLGRWHTAAMGAFMNRRPGSIRLSTLGPGPAAVASGAHPSPRPRRPPS